MATSSSIMTHDTQLKSYQKRLKDDIKSITDNFEHIIKLMKIDESQAISGGPSGGSSMMASKVSESTFEMRIRVGNMLRAGESIMKLIWDIKQYLIINDFPLINETIVQKSDYSKVIDIDQKLMMLRDEISNELYDLEDEYYNSLTKMVPPTPVSVAPTSGGGSGGTVPTEATGTTGTTSTTMTSTTQAATQQPHVTMSRCHHD